MGYGLSVHNSSGYIQLDSNYSRFTVYSEGTVTTAWRTIGSFQGMIAAIELPTNVARNAIVLVRPPLNILCAAVPGTPVSASVERINIASNSAATIPYMIAVRSNIVNPSSVTHGLRIWSGDGGLVFDSGLPFVTATQFVNFNAYSMTTNATNITVNSDSSYDSGAYLMASTRIMFLRPVESIGNFMAPGRGYTSSSNVRISFISVSVGPNPNHQTLTFGSGAAPFFIGRKVSA